MKYFSFTNKKMTVSLLSSALIFAGVSVLPSVAHADDMLFKSKHGITIAQDSPTKSLNVLGRINETTAVYTDASGLKVPVPMAKIAKMNSLRPYEEVAPPVQLGQEPASGTAQQPVTQAPNDKVSSAAVAVQNIEPAAGDADVKLTAKSVIPPQEKLFQFYDNNGDGLISSDEFFVYKATIKAYGEFKTMDANGDKYIDRKEFGAV